ncbi:hypothetical protein V6N12_048074 [Hibiscus sabdariffa]|uniref:Uncharacterized protein n=1 Tax=Hibiscus sabdariffa TaxID=183260 RepID=A0ABR2CUV1_9ROSI
MATDPRRAAIFDDLDCMGFSKKDLDPSNEVAVDSDVEMVHESVSAGNLESWAKGVNSLNNPKNKGLDEIAVDEAESVSVDFTLKNANDHKRFGTLVSELKVNGVGILLRFHKAQLESVSFGIKSTHVFFGDEEEIVEETVRLEGEQQHSKLMVVLGSLRVDLVVWFKLQQFIIDLFKVWS